MSSEPTNEELRDISYMHSPRFQLDGIDLGCSPENASSDPMDVLRGDLLPLTGGQERDKLYRFPIKFSYPRLEAWNVWNTLLWSTTWLCSACWLLRAYGYDQLMVYAELCISTAFAPKASP
jgi:hypothetical protein